ncbi:TPA: hypothetical protein P5R74_003060 [Legionella pneumophila]|nr:hypothetical protein [Legionella pneumophila]HDP0036730.1 hypothetical protein [Legionella pneumophila]
MRLRLLSLIACRPASVLGPVDRPPCNLQRPFTALSLKLSQTGGALHKVFFLVLALHVPLSDLRSLGELANNEIRMLKFLSKYSVAILMPPIPYKSRPHDGRVYSVTLHLFDHKKPMDYSSFHGTLVGHSEIKNGDNLQ